MTSSEINNSQHFDNHDLLPYQSDYLHQGKSQERWFVHSAHINNNDLSALISIDNPYFSATDPGGFHLSVFSAQEFCTELILFWTMKKLRLSRKSQEAWMRECHCRIIRPIRTHKDISAQLKINNYRVMNGMAYAKGDFQISDISNGLFILSLSGGLRFQDPLTRLGR